MIHPMTKKIAWITSAIVVLLGFLCWQYYKLGDGLRHGFTR